MPTDAIECPLCLGEGKLKRTEVLDRLGVKDFARVAQLSAEEAFRLLLQKHHRDEQTVWARFETELTKRTAEIERRHEMNSRHSVVGSKNSSLLHESPTSERLSMSNRCGRNWKLSSAQSIRRRKTSIVESKTILRRSASFGSGIRSWKPKCPKSARIGRLEEKDFADEARTWAGMSRQ